MWYVISDHGDNKKIRLNDMLMNNPLRNQSTFINDEGILSFYCLKRFLVLQNCSRALKIGYISFN